MVSNWYYRHQSDLITLTLERALANCPIAMPNRKSGPRKVMMARLNLSRSGWYHLSWGEPALGYVETQAHRSNVTRQDHKMSKDPLSSLLSIHPTICWGSDVLELMVTSQRQYENKKGIATIRNLTAV
jgi:hypothetical protein